MNIRDAIDHLFLIAADGHVSAEDGSYLHPREGENACATCVALETALAFCESGMTPKDIPDEPEQDEIEFVGSNGTSLMAQWHCVTGQFHFTTQVERDDMRLLVSVPMSTDQLIELRDKMLNPVILFNIAAAELERREKERREREEAERRAQQEREQTFRAVSVARTVTPNLTVHGHACSALEFARKRQTLGTVIFAFTPDRLIAKLPTAMTGRLSLRFCTRCGSIPEARRFNAELIGAAPEIVPEDLLLANLSNAIWEAHHTALENTDKKESHA